MRNSWILMLVLFASSSALADTHLTSIIKISEASSNQTTHLVMLSYDGRVGFLGTEQKELLAQLKKSMASHQAVEVDLDENSRITGVKPSTRSMNPAMTLNLEPYKFNLAAFQPTVLSSYAEANAIFLELNPNARNDSECYNRAEVWSYEEFHRRNLYSQKVFLFFTEKYIREYNYFWWFHVSPYTLVADGQGVTEYTIDFAFLEQPETLKDWTDHFIEPHAPCKEAFVYSQYSQHQEDAYCYVIKRPMYFWQPRDIENQELTGAVKTEFIESDVDWAYHQGF